MATQTVRVVARILARPGQAEALRAILLELVEATREESGCISYRLLQNRADPADFTFMEEWDSDEAIDAHLSSTHLQDAITKAQTLFAAPPDIRRYSAIA